MGKLDGVCRASSGSKSRSEPQDEAATHELTAFMGGGLNGCSNEDDETSDEDTDSSSVAIGKETTERESRDLSKIVDNEDETCAGPSAAETECLLVRFHGVDAAHEGRIWDVSYSLRMRVRD